MNEIVKQMCPPLIWNGLRSIKKKYFPKRILSKNGNPSEQDLDVYWNPKMAEILEKWGEGNVWHELKFIMVGLRGRILDIACGTGKNICDLSSFADLDIYGCDISDFLIQKAMGRGISKDKLKVCDATKSGYSDNFFDYSYSIGSLEHFTEKGIEDVISECYRITRNSSFHNIPISKSGENMGWIKTTQSYFNNSIDWWKAKFNQTYSKVITIDSLWHDDISCGEWFICMKDA